MYKLLAALAGLALACSTSTSAQTIKVVVPFAAGGPVDTLARLITSDMAPRLKTDIVVENRGGAGGSLGTAVAARANPDGHTMLFTLSSHSINPAIYASLPFDTERDFRPVSLVASLPQLFAVNPGMAMLPATSRARGNAASISAHSA